MFGTQVGKSVVDANHFPAGFNNVSEENIAELSTLFKDHIQRSHPEYAGGFTSTLKATPGIKPMSKTSRR